MKDLDLCNQAGTLLISERKDGWKVKYIEVYSWNTYIHIFLVKFISVQVGKTVNWRVLRYSV